MPSFELMKQAGYRVINCSIGYYDFVSTNGEQKIGFRKTYIEAKGSAIIKIAVIQAYNKWLAEQEKKYDSGTRNCD